VLDLMHELQVGRHARGGVEPEFDRRRRPALSRRPRAAIASARSGR
jgi:hypothetical protein